MAKVCSFIPEHQSSGKTMTPLASPPHPPPRRLRVREVSSRFMSPVVSSSSSGDLHLPSSKCPIPKHTTTELGSKTHHRSQSAHRRQLDHQQPPPEPLSCADDNRIDMMQRSLETPFLGSHSKQFPFSSSTVHTKKNPSSVRVYKENGGGGGGGSGKHLPRPRPDTPNVMFQGIDRRIATAPRSPTVARKLVQLSGMSLESSSSSLDCATPCPDNLVDLSAPIETKSSHALDHQGICNSPTFRSSMPETDFLQTMSSRRSCDSWNVGGDSSKLSACHRSLNSAISQQNFSNASKSVFKPPAFPSKPNPNSLKSSANFLPPQPSYAKVGAETSKGRKSHAEDFHTLRLLHNRYLQWRYVNARAETTMNAQLIAAQKSLHALVVKISELHDSVEKKHSELVRLKKDGIISIILENQKPYLDEWSALEGEYSSSLSEAIKALQDASLRLPVVGNASITEIAGALNSASNVMDLLFLLVESFLPKGEEMDTLMSQLAVVVSRERSLIEECGDLLTKAHNLQVEECSLRGQLIQLKQRISWDQVRSNQ